MIRYYLSTVLGDGSINNPFRPLIDTILVPNVQWQWQDARANQQSSTGSMLAWGDVTNAQHATLVGTGGITYVPFEDSQGNVLATSAAIGELDATKRSQIQTWLESHHVPMQGLSLQDRIYVVVNRALVRFRLRQYLGGNDYTEVLNNQVSSIPAAKRNAIRDTLESLGFDMSGLTGSMTIRQALLALMTQESAA